MIDETLRKKFEETELFKTITSCYYVVYSNYGGYFVGSTPHLYLNGAFNMFQELNKED